MMLMMLRIIAIIHAQDFIVYNPQPTIKPTIPRMSVMAPIAINSNSNPVISAASAIKPNPATIDKIPPRICSIPRIVTPSGLSLEGEEYPVVGVGISAIFLPFQTFTSISPTEILSNIVHATEIT